MPDFFTPSTHEDVRRDLPGSPAWVAVERDRLLGFVLARRRFSSAAEITFAAVIPSWRDLAASGLQVVQVKTLDASAGYEPYLATRAFWERRGFVQVDTIDPLPGWVPGNPAAIYARPLSPATCGRTQPRLHE